ncbi:Kinetochore-Ndc80 subunit Spc24, partial [Trinorchestia longiramus]
VKHSDLPELAEQLINVKKLVSQSLHQLEVQQLLIQSVENGILQCDRLRQDFDLAQDQLKETISELSSTEAEEHEQLAALRTALQGRAAADLIADIDLHIENVRSCKAATARAKEQILAQQQLLSSVREQCKQLSSHCPALLHQTKKKMDVYSCLTRIKWKYDSPEDEVCGFVARPDKKDVIPFKLDTKNSSQYFVTNFLWDQLACNSSDFL